jgi:membrane protease YdiL (CAAX protease family)
MTSTLAAHSDPRDLLHRHPLAVFFGCTYALSWALWAPLVILGDGMPSAAGLLLAVLGSLVPSTVGLVLTAKLHGPTGVRELLGRLLRFRVGARWYLAAFGLPLLVPLGLGISILVGGDAPTLDTTAVTVLAIFAFSIFPGSALGEELGWRGFALPRQQANHSALYSSLVIGLLWGCWHLPLYLLGRDNRPLGIFPAFVLAVIASSVLCTWLYNSTGGSLLIVVLYHAAANLPLTVLLEPLGTRAAQPFLLYVALSVVVATAIVLIAGPEDLSRTRRRQIVALGD